MSSHLAAGHYYALLREGTEGEFAEFNDAFVRPVT
jgi:hypothetical protein